MKILGQIQEAYQKKKSSTMSIEEYLKAAKKDPSMYASPAERMLKAIGEPKLVHTSKDVRLSRIFSNRLLKSYPTFKDFYGMEDVIERLVSFFKHAAQGLEESRQILYLLGPVGSAKSSLAERLKELMEQEPIYALADHEGNISPVRESPLGLFSETQADELGIPVRYLHIRPSPWALKREEEYEGDLARFQVVKIFPSRDRQVCISKTEPGDENNQDISTLVGKLDIRKLEFYSQNDPDAYNYSGGLCLSNQGILEFVEMFKAPIKVLNPLLTATQERNYKGTEAIGALPFDGVILAHSNESEWSTFKNDSNNEAFLDRVFIVEVPYCLRVDEEVLIYKKLINTSDLKTAPVAPKTLEMLAKFCVATRLDRPDNSHLESKLLTYNGESVKDRDNKAKSYHEYKETACRDEGFFGISTRLAYKILSEVYNFDPEEVAADPVHLIFVIDSVIRKERYPKDKESLYLDFLQKLVADRYHQDLTKDIQTAYLESYSEYGQALFDRYILFADHWIQDNDYRDPDTGNMFDRGMLNAELEKIEKPAQIANPKDFRNEIVNFALRAQAKNDGANPKWTSYEKLRRVIETTMFNKTEDLLPIISFGNHSTSDDKKKHAAFVDRMKELGYTERQVKRLVEWHIRKQKN